MIKKDNLHYNPNLRDSYNKQINITISERELGKSTEWAWKVWKKFLHNHRPSIILRRQQVDITEAYIDSIGATINQFLPDNKQIKLEYKRGAFKDGVVDVKVNKRDIFRVVALSVPKGRLKSLVYEDPAYMIWDEMLIDTRGGEKWLPDEGNKFAECFTTFNRHAVKHGHQMKVLVYGNPYTTYCPLFAWLDIDISLIKPGAFIVGDRYILECPQLSQELRDKILEVNPMYHFSDEYKRYAFGGEAVNDQNYDIHKDQPQGYTLKYIFRIANKYLAIWHKPMNRDKPGYDCGKYWVSTMKNYTGSKKIYAVDFDNLINDTRLITTDIRAIMWRFKDAIANRDISYQTVECGYLIEAIYKSI